MGAFGTTAIKVFKPVIAGVALAFLATAFVDGPPPVQFQKADPYAAKQGGIIEPQAELVIEKNVMKLGSLFSFTGDQSEGMLFGDPEFNTSPKSDAGESTVGSSVKGEVAPPPAP